MTVVTTPDPTVAALLAGDATAWKRLYLEHRDVMYAAAMKTLRNRHDTEEAVQEAFTSVMAAGAEPLGGVKNIRSYMARAARNKAIDIIRSRSRTSATDPDAVALLDDTFIDVEDAATNNVATEIGLALLHEMPDKVAYAYRERVLKGRKAKDVAAELACDPSHIPNLVGKAVEYITDHSPFVDRAAIDPPSTEGKIGTKDPL